MSRSGIARSTKLLTTSKVYTLGPRAHILRLPPTPSIPAGYCTLPMFAHDIFFFHHQDDDNLGSHGPWLHCGERQPRQISSKRETFQHGFFIDDRNDCGLILDVFWGISRIVQQPWKNTYPNLLIRFGLVQKLNLVHKFWTFSYLGTHTEIKPCHPILLEVLQRGYNDQVLSSFLKSLYCVWMNAVTSPKSKARSLHRKG